MTKLQALLHAGELRIAATLPDAPVSLRELQDFRVRFTESDNATFNSREGAQDDLVLTLALAVLACRGRKLCGKWGWFVGDADVPFVICEVRPHSLLSS